jgi:hypothetical protein
MLGPYRSYGENLFPIPLLCGTSHATILLGKPSLVFFLAFWNCFPSNSGTRYSPFSS